MRAVELTTHLRRRSAPRLARWPWARIRHPVPRPDGLLKTTTLPTGNGHAETRTYDNAGKLKTLTNKRGTTVLSSAAYDYDPNGNPTRITRQDEVVTYQYNVWNMLLQACYTTSCDTSGATTDTYFKYRYDKNGNRTTKERPVGGVNEVTTYTYNAADQLTAKDGPSGPCANYEYDDNGNLTRQCGMTYAYNDANKLTAATSTGGATNGSTQRYTYDGDGNRLTAATSTGTTAPAAANTTKYQWDLNNPLPQLARETNGSNALQRRYTQGLDTIAMTTGAGTFYYHYDGLGSVTALTNATGTVQAQYNYEAYGDLRRSTQTAGAPTNPLRYTGEYYDTFTDTYHLRARQYDTHLGRFTQTDPHPAQVADPYVGRYVYVNNKPTTLVDPSGRIAGKASATSGGDAGTFSASLTCDFGVCEVIVGIVSDFRVFAWSFSYLVIASGDYHAEIDSGESLFGTYEIYDSYDFEADTFGPVYVIVTATAIGFGVSISRPLHLDLAQ
ncbi:RHS repeat domain-containing protein [Vallicoccus soli]|uniref:RHS repeat domain-containing protein n=1 Tax=Vallicoccus soli TaxID=2339232 RepID=UPI001059C6F1|nr:RHS repeat-associated core domain-containing protein [Vallicoccus soli]